MPYLALDGIRIPVKKDSAQENYESLGGRDRAISGAMIDSTRATKRSWRFTTPVISRSDKDALVGLLLSKGKLFSFDDDTANSTDGYVAPVATALEFVAGIPTSSSSRDLLPDVPFGHRRGNKAMWVGKNTTNIAAAGTGTFTSGITGISAHGPISAAVAHETNQSVDGPGAGGCVKVTTGTDGQGGMATLAVTAATGRCFGQVAIAPWQGDSSAVGKEIVVWLHSPSGAGDGPKVRVTLESGKWTRVFVSADVELDVEMRIVSAFGEDLVTGPQFHFAVDQLAITEVSPSHKWFDSGAGGSDGEHRIIDGTTTFARSSDWSRAWSFNVWCQGQSLDPSGSLTILSGSGPGPFFVLGTEFASGIVELQVGDNASSFGDTVSSLEDDDYLGDDAWHMWTVVFVLAADGTWSAQLWRDGVLQATYEAPDDAPFIDPTTFDYCGLGDSSNTPAFFDDLMMVPYALSKMVIEGLYNEGAGGQIGAWPKHRLTGNVIGNGPAVDVVGEVSTFRPIGSVGPDGVWRNDSGELEFVLHEV